ncbi:2,3-diaminopropionate biosynthesis protein SbnA [Pelagovum pacificum]|uniref:N-(2-amino-2-carboxyethyl)-L-glutamate synthase n=1 Tax=Pelagovum pacificum TaxID=2588711 RepID=A0A5C5GDS3_9RHOB|nr:2,3-diaminopropionate biosynthesis protein SbnA [Pelagovum pacificum]QQA41451.1 2,3-diaminopropionate biosynthesis protein SbnA [Pelagovum pacificum]TNY31746.1 2,3-diaminopropionate biosynthesis protein SbnA [Pelagovum pacificum]
MNIQITKAAAADRAIAPGILSLVGGTPLVRFTGYLGDPDVELIVKYEAANPGGSAKDRPARQMIEQALRRGDLTPGATVIESTSGNMGIGLAQACRVHGLKLICVVDPKAQPQNVAIMRALGAQIHLVTDPIDGDFLAARMEAVGQLLDQTPGAFWTNQYANLDNPTAHTEGTMQEIDDILGGTVDALFVATSSTGTARGCRDFLERRGRKTEVVAVDAEGSCLFDGTAGPRHIPGMGAGRIPALAEGQRFDGLERVSDLTCVVGCRRAAQREAVLVGGSAGGVLEAVRARRAQLRGKRVVAILHDSGTRYLDTVFNDEWVERTLGVSAQDLAGMVGADER